jgi:molybdopterin synthase catalytic subunit
MAAAITVLILSTALDPIAEARAFSEHHRDAGAIVSFTGLVRSDGGAVDALELEHYPQFTQSEIERLATEAAERWRLAGAVIAHRVGRIEPNDPIVFVAAASAHRREAFEAVDFLMDHLKSAAPFWKKEISRGSAKWTEPRKEDYADIARWKEAPHARRR